MTVQARPPEPPPELLRMANGMVISQCLFAVAKLGVADLLADGPRSVADLATQLQVSESALCRVLRLLATEGVFKEASPRAFANTELSYFLRSEVPGSFHSRLIFSGSEFFFSPFQQILHSVQTGEPAGLKVHGMGDFEYLQRNPAQARIFDDAMTSMSAAIGPAIAAAYDFGRWGSVMDVGGGNGMLLSFLLRAHPHLRGVLADLPHVLERARERGYLSGELQERAAMQPCDFFKEVPSGCRAIVMKSVIHDWEDEKARKILEHCRRAAPADGALLLVEWVLTEGNEPSGGKLVDVVMLVLTGGRERTAEEFRKLLASAGFRLNQIVPTPAGAAVIEALPA